jgi:GTP cyclohydrolase II/3,4-dihydroxy 2-butanone 4-phosphate synthase/GTP cyclohydrolase II
MPSPQSLPLIVPPEVPELRVYGRAHIPTARGTIDMVSFRTPEGRTIDHVAIVIGDVAGRRGVPTRVHSECLTSEVFGSLRCDCREQLDSAIERFAAGGVGLLLYMRQEGRGIGIAHKVRAYELQDRGLDTVDANLHLGFDDDLRSYEDAAAMIEALGVASVVLHTNNPRKIESLRTLGIEVAERKSLVVPARAENRDYLATKRDRSGHLL